MRTAEWTILVYMAADNSSLGPVAGSLLEEMTAASSGDEVRLAVELVFRDTRRFEIADGKAHLRETRALIDTGKPRYLTEFLRWGARELPARHTALVILGHGNGVDDWEVGSGPQNRIHVQPPPRPSQGHHQHAIGFSDTFSDALTLAELEDALASSGVQLALLGLDACMMGMLEVAYQIRRTARLLVASEPYATPWPYGTILRRLMRKPRVSPEALARTILDTFAETPATPGEMQTLAAIDLGEVHAVGEALGGAVRQLRAAMLDPEKVAALRAARNQTLAFGGYTFADLGRLLANLAHERFPMAPLRRAFERSIRGVRQVGVPPLGLERAGGMAIYFPQTSAQFGSAQLAMYQQLELPRVTGWGAFLEAWKDQGTAAPAPRPRRAPGFQALT